VSIKQFNVYLLYYIEWFSLTEMGQLFKKANASVSNGDMRPFKVFYRCKPAKYFENIRVKCNRIMRPYVKDANGHRASPINGVCVCVCLQKGLKSLFRTLTRFIFLR
jgi:hypothetical protein